MKLIFLAVQDRFSKNHSFINSCIQSSINNNVKKKKKRIQKNTSTKRKNSRNKKREKKNSKRKLFPGYIFIKMSMNKNSWQLINKTLGVTGFIGNGEKYPTPISKKEINKILELMKKNKKLIPKPKTTFQINEIVRILEGPFTDFTGKVEKINYEKSKLYIAVSIFGRSTPVELLFKQVTKDI